MRLMIATEDGEVLDYARVTPAEFREAQLSPAAAYSLLRDLTPGTVDEGDDEDPADQLDDADAGDTTVDEADAYLRTVGIDPATIRLNR